MNIKLPLNRVIVVYFALVFLVCLLLMTKFTLNIDTNFGVIIFFLMLLPFMFVMKFPNTELKLILFVIMFIGMCLHSFFYSPITGIDSARYYAQYQNFSSTMEFFRFAWIDIKEYGLNVSSYTLFGLVYIPYFNLFGIDNPAMISTFNAFFLICTCSLAYVIFKDHFHQNTRGSKIFVTLFLIEMFASSNLLYWTNAFNKDFFCLFLCMFCLLLFLKKRYAWLSVITFYAFLLRPYNILVMFIYYVFLKDKMKLAVLASIGAALYMFKEAGIAGFINTFLNVGYSLIAPNPFSLENWQAFGYRSFESVFTIVGVVASFIVYLLNKDSRRFYKLSCVCVYLYSCVLTYVGSSNLISNDIEYIIGSGGDSFQRKRLLLVILLYVVFAYTFTRLSSKYKTDYISS